MQNQADFILKVATAAIAVAALIVSIVGTRNALRVARRALAKADQDEEKEYAKVLWETTEVGREVRFLDEWIWEKRVFARKKAILDALEAIRMYLKTNYQSLRLFLGADSRPYRALRGLYDIALQNHDNEPPPTGLGEWRGITQENLLGYQVGQLLDKVARELERRRKGQPFATDNTDDAQRLREDQ